MSSYSILGTNCSQQTIALTSNQKFLPPLDNIYSDFFTHHMLMYPGQEETRNLYNNQFYNNNHLYNNRLDVRKYKKCQKCQRN